MLMARLADDRVLIGLPGEPISALVGVITLLGPVIAAMRAARAIAATAAMKPLVKREVSPGGDAVSDQDLLDYARHHGATIFHPSGTCRMGADAQAVVDDELRVHGLEGLRVADCSIMPTLVSGNTNAAAVMIAEKAAQMMLQAHAG